MINTLKRPVSDIKLMIVTHMHPDHAGAVRALRKKYKILIATYYITDNWHKGICGTIQHFIDIALARFVVIKSRKSVSHKRGGIFSQLWYKRFVKADYLLKNNVQLPFFTDWKVIYTPGHTAHDISLYNTEQKILYIADNIVAVNGRYMLPFPVVFPKTMKRSLQTLSELEISELLFAHGEMSKKSNKNKILERLSHKTFDKAKGHFKILKFFMKFAVCFKTPKLSDGSEF